MCVGGGGGGGGGDGAGVRIFFGGGSGGGGGDGGCGGVVDGWTDKQAQTNLPLQLLPSWGHNNASMYKLCPDKLNL